MDLQKFKRSIKAFQEEKAFLATISQCVNSGLSGRRIPGGQDRRRPGLFVSRTSGTWRLHNPQLIYDPPHRRRMPNTLAPDSCQKTLDLYVDLQDDYSPTRADPSHAQLFPNANYEFQGWIPRTIDGILDLWMATHFVLKLDLSTGH